MSVLILRAHMERLMGTGSRACLTMLRVSCSRGLCHRPRGPPQKWFLVRRANPEVRDPRRLQRVRLSRLFTEARLTDLSPPRQQSGSGDPTLQTFAGLDVARRRFNHYHDLMIKRVELVSRIVGQLQQMETRIDRLARSSRDLLNVIKQITDIGATFKSIRDQ